MRHYEGPPVHRGESGRFDGVLLYCLISGLAVSTRRSRRQGRTWTHTQAIGMDDRSVRMLLSFQRPSRPLQGRDSPRYDAARKDVPSGQWSLAQPSVLRKASRGVPGQPSPQRRRTVAAAAGNRTPPAASGYAQAPEVALAELHHAPVDRADRDVEDIGGQRLAVDAHPTLGQHPPCLGA